MNCGANNRAAFYDPASEGREQRAERLAREAESGLANGNATETNGKEPTINGDVKVEEKATTEPNGVAEDNQAEHAEKVTNGDVKAAAIENTGAA
jgi:hypothetical protein